MNTVIDLVGEALEIPVIDIEVIQKGREFLNMVKGHKAKFSTYKNGLAQFYEANKIMERHGIIFFG